MHYVHVSTTPVATYSLGPPSGVNTAAAPPMPDAAKPGPYAVDDPELGTFLFQRSSSSWPLWIFLGFGVFIVTLAISLVPGQYGGSGGAWAIPLVLGAIFIGLPALGLMYRPGPLRFHQRGIVTGRPGREQRLRYDQIKTLTYGVARTYVNGAYSGTTLRFLAEADRALKLKPVKYNGRHGEKRIKRGFFQRDFEGGDQLDALHNALSEGVAHGMVARIRSGEKVQWGRKLAISTAGVHHGSRVTPLATITGAQLNNGELSIFASTSPKAVCKCKVSEPNHLAGLLALNMLLTQIGNGFGGSSR